MKVGAPHVEWVEAAVAEVVVEAAPADAAAV